jgi:hypothetical protein
MERHPGEGNDYEQIRMAFTQAGGGPDSPRGMPVTRGSPGPALGIKLTAENGGPQKGNHAMKRLLTGRMAAVLMAGAALLASGATAVPALAATAGTPHVTMATRSVTTIPTVQPDFTCPRPSVCLFPNNDFTGNYPAWDGPAVLATDVWNGQWYSFAQADASNPNPGSLNDNSNSVMWVYAKNINVGFCLTPGRYTLQHTYGYFFIEFGITTCPSNDRPPKPFP